MHISHVEHAEEYPAHPRHHSTVALSWHHWHPRHLERHLVTLRLPRVTVTRRESLTLELDEMREDAFARHRHKGRRKPYVDAIDDRVHGPQSGLECREHLQFALAPMFNVTTNDERGILDWRTVPATVAQAPKRGRASVNAGIGTSSRPMKRESRFVVPGATRSPDSSVFDAACQNAR